MNIKKTASFIKRMFQEGQNSIYIEVLKNDFNIGFQPFRGSENAYYLGNENQTIEQIQEFLNEKQNYVKSQPKTVKRFYRRY